MSHDYAHLRAALSDRYAIERELGSGGMATVYLAQDLKHHRKVALKVLRPEVGATLGADRFIREIQIAARLTHPHIVPLYDSGRAGGLLYYVMPYIQGESLRERIDREGSLSVDEALQIAREVAAALSHAHGNNVIHRDIKPENILFSGGEAVVTDFGIARAISAAGGSGITHSGLPLGTLGYMSPEQAMGRGELDARTDVYSLGCVLYEMVVGQPPGLASTFLPTLPVGRGPANRPSGSAFSCRLLGLCQGRACASRLGGRREPTQQGLHRHWAGQGPLGGYNSASPPVTVASED